MCPKTIATSVDSHFGKTAGVQAAATGKFEQASESLSARSPNGADRSSKTCATFSSSTHSPPRWFEDKMLAHTALAEAEIACGRAYAIIGELESLTAEHPYREPLWAQLMTAYYLAERQSDALDAYRRLKSTLAEDLGIDPGRTVQALYERILRQEPLDVKRVARTTAIHTANRSTSDDRDQRRILGRPERDGDSGRTRSHPTAIAARVLPDDYDGSVCEPAHPPVTGRARRPLNVRRQGQHAAVARYSIFADQPTLDQHFKDAIAQNSGLAKAWAVILTRLPPGTTTRTPTSSPARWHAAPTTATPT